jgi:hypothetical protein
MRDCDGTFRRQCSLEDCKCEEFGPANDIKIVCECGHRANRHHEKGNETNCVKKIYKKLFSIHYISVYILYN